MPYTLSYAGLETRKFDRDRFLQDLMLHRVHEILLVASPYDAYTLEQDGRLTEQILHEYLGMNLFGNCFSSENSNFL